MTAPSERVNMADDANRSSRSSRSSRSATSTTTADILEEAFSTDSMKKFNGHGSSATIGARRGRKKSSENREEGDDDEDLNNEIMDEIYATDSMKRFKKKNSMESPGSTSSGSTEESTGRHRRTGRRCHEGDLTSIKEDKSAHNLVEGLRSFRLEKERLTRGSSGGNKQQMVFTPKMA